MEIAAVGLPVPLESWTGQVHSVFHSSVNLRGPGEALLCVHRFPFGLLPGSYLVPGLDTSGLRPGDRAVGRTAGLWVGKLELPLAPDVRYVDTRIPPSRQPVRPAAWTAQRRALVLRRAEQQENGWMEGVYARLTWELAKLRTAVEARDLKELQQRCAAMVGLGQGLTPTGDDMLLGALSALHMYRPEGAALLAEALKPLLPCTNDISRSYLWQALEGRAATPVIMALEDLASGGGRGAGTLLDIGHSSGGDILEGILSMTAPGEETKRPKEGTRERKEAE